MDAEEKKTKGFQPTRPDILKLWGQIKEQAIGDLSPIERFYAAIIKTHEEMFTKEVDGVENPETHEYKPSEGVNPYLHILLHGLVSTQLLGKAPMEAVQFANAMKKRGLDDHATQHLLSAIFFPIVLEARNKGGAADMVKYAALLKKFKTKKPEKINAAIDRTFEVTVA